jgi:signal transduction histidine kinase
VSAGPDVIAAWAAAAAGASLAASMARRGSLRRRALNEALHELRRPLQALALATVAGPAGAGESSLRLTRAALQRLDRELNGIGGDDPGSRVEVVVAEQVLGASVERWRAGAAAAGCTLNLRWRGGGAAVVGGTVALEQAIDNLIANAIEHGGPDIVVEGLRRDARLVISVVDSGDPPRPEAEGRRTGRAPGSPRGAGRRPTRRVEGALARLTARRRRGHGLALVRPAASAHGGRFVLSRGEGSTRAVLELDLAPVAGR